MRQIRRSGLATLMVTGGALALSAGAAHADAGAQGAAVGSPGVISGNSVQLPVHVPVNACGNTVSVVGLLNPAFGNSCENRSGGSDGVGRAHKDQPGTPRAGQQGGHSGHTGGNASNGGGAAAEGVAHHSPGVISGNGLQLPIDLPANLSGNSINVVGVGNPVYGNTAVNGPATPETPRVVTPPTETVENPPAPSTAVDMPAPQPHAHSAALASTGSDTVGIAAPAGAALLLGGALMYRRARRTGGAA
ncbi:chaplin [Streptomyces sp. NBC_01216]|uniref:chaplin n=1 Tax=Streptomyces sp. NBC_01216 TaxID=2903778 RepID=UPI002E13EAAA